MQVIDKENKKIILFIYLSTGLFIILFGISKLYYSSFNYKTYDKIKGRISQIKQINIQDSDDSNYIGLQISIKDYPDKICFYNLQLKDKLAIGDSITVYLKRKSKGKMTQNNFGIYGLRLKGVYLIDLIESNRRDIWIGIASIIVGFIIVSLSIYSYVSSKNDLYKRVDKGIDINQPFL